MTTYINNDPSDELIAQITDDFLYALMPFGSADLRACMRAIIALDITPSHAADIIIDYCNDLGIALTSTHGPTLDVNAIIWDYALELARTEIAEATEYAEPYPGVSPELAEELYDDLSEVDIVNDYDWYTYCNYCCTEYDSTSNTPERHDQLARDIALAVLSRSIDMHGQDVSLVDDPALTPTDLAFYARYNANKFAACLPRATVFFLENADLMDDVREHVQRIWQRLSDDHNKQLNSVLAQIGDNNTDKEDE